MATDHTLRYGSAALACPCDREYEVQVLHCSGITVIILFAVDTSDCFPRIPWRAFDGSLPVYSTLNCTRRFTILPGSTILVFVRIETISVIYHETKMPLFV